MRYSCHSETIGGWGAKIYGVDAVLVTKGRFCHRCAITVDRSTSLCLQLSSIPISYRFREDFEMRTFVHVGQHKTATTSIQYFLRRNAEMLLKRGLYVPDKLAGFGNPSHFALNVYSLDRKRMSSMKEKLLFQKRLCFNGS